MPSYSDVALPKRRRRWQWLLAALLIVPLVGFFFITSFLRNNRPVRIEGEAMSPTLNNGDKVFVTARYERINRGDIVIFYFPKDTAKSHLKRVIGLPGEEIRIERGRVFVNGNVLDEPYLDPKYLSNETLRPMKLDAESCFVMGDNRRNSYDSRNWGALPTKLIYGKFVRRYWSAE
ncbi:MAG TPA: signal peptidase I [Blastocatellia bacterium]|nr:signal peptidase I [Blastocatellia bacterium]